jgi:hypothetical protein
MPDHTVPYGTVLWVGAFPGTSCQATIMLSLRDEIHAPRRGFNSAYGVNPWLNFPGPVGQRGDSIHAQVFGKCPNSEQAGTACLLSDAPKVSSVRDPLPPVFPVT